MGLFDGMGADGKSGGFGGDGIGGGGLSGLDPISIATGVLNGGTQIGETLMKGNFDYGKADYSIADAKAFAIFIFAVDVLSILGASDNMLNRTNNTMRKELAKKTIKQNVYE